MEKKHSQAFLRKRKMLLVLPLFFIPFLSMAFYVLGGGKGDPQTTANVPGNKGYNLNLPGAKFSKESKEVDKLSAYKKADQDSARLKDQLRQDPYHSGSMASINELPQLPGLKSIRPDKDQPQGQLKALVTQDTTADVVLQRLETLKRSLKQPDMPEHPDLRENVTSIGNSSVNPNVNKLAEMMQQIKDQSKEPEQDPQLETLNAMLDKIMRIQHPESAGGATDTSKRIGAAENYMLKNKAGSEVVNLAPGLTPADSKVFFSTDDAVTDSTTDNVIAAIIDGDQTLVSGGTLDMRLTEDAVVKGIAIPRNTRVHGRIMLSGERMNVAITTIKTPNGIFPVALQVYDFDGLVGIKIPGAITRDVAKESADQAVNSIGFTTMDPSLKAQAASAGIQAAKTLASRKIKVIKANVPNGYLIYLMNTKN